ncbi:nitrate- and nitrite sensing domain-containing protein [Actinokineospora sp. HUAS TT18]|uniref:sensor histidine kinase n=1 Tax=Actinokineospora sp. HUAS TT18 TaxID=3447451 RepID=UPI003F527D2D
MARLNRLGGSGTIQSRVLAIVLIPSIAIMVVGGALSAYLAYQGVSTQSFADNVRASLGPSSRVIVAVQEERRLTTLKLVGEASDPGEITRQRGEVDAAVKDLAATTEALAEEASGELSGPLQKLNKAALDLPDLRNRVDQGSATPQQVYDFYSDLVDLVSQAVQGIARSATDAEVGFEQMISSELFRSVEAQARSHVLVERAMTAGLDHKDYHELAHQMGTYHELIETIVPRLTEVERKQYAALKATPEWKTVVAGDDAIMALGPGKHKATFDVAAWEKSNRTVSGGLADLYKAHSTYAADLGTSSGSAVLTTSLVAAGLILLIAVAAMLIALRLSRKLIHRLTKLRVETIDVAENRLPDMVERVGRGEKVDVEAEVPRIDHGDDEIGQLAAAFGDAQRTAVAATAREAEVREGVRSVFLNIAHRSQVMVHRQLKVLDRAERSEDDPDQLALLFQLDHLATRARRNAESLIILGGKQPGRRWRNPVSLLDVVRSAVAETEDYERVTTGKLPQVALEGAVIADLIHVIAELVENATAFSPPETQVDVMGTLVARGVVIEIEDQGLGIEEDKLEEFNRRLQSPPDFGVMALSGESRIGLFVVARLAAQHGIKVALRESIYGGVRAVVLVPNSVLVRDGVPDTEVPAARAEQRPAPQVERTSGHLPVDATSTVDTMPHSAPTQRIPMSSLPAEPLARREPRATLAPQLRNGAQPVEPAPMPTPERSRATMSAFQRGTRRARAGEQDSNGRPAEGT